MMQVLKNSGCIVKMAGLMALIAMVISLAACSSDREPPLAMGMCPQVAIIRSLDTMTMGTGTGHLVSLKGDCAKVDAGIDINFTLGVGVERDKAPSTMASVSLPIVVGIVDPSGSVVASKTFDIDFSLPPQGAEARVVHEELMHVVLPMNPDHVVLSEQYRVLVGFKTAPNKPVTP